MGLNLIAALWGFAEATLFFIVPDVALTTIALRNGWRAGIFASLAAALGAAAGGLVMYRWGVADAETARRIADHLPAISPAMIAEVRQSLSEQGFAAMVAGAFRGVPYKLYAIESGAAARDVLQFFADSFAARLSRFCIVVSLAAGLGALLRRWLSPRTILAMSAAGWLVFYAAYWSLMPD